MRSIATEPKKAEGNEIQSTPELWRRLTQQEQHLRVRIKVEGDLEARAAGQGIPVMVAYHRSVVMHHEGELKTLLWIMEAAQEQMAELAALADARQEVERLRGALETHVIMVSTGPGTPFVCDECGAQSAVSISGIQHTAFCPLYQEPGA